MPERSKEKPTVSVVIPTYCRAHLIGEAIQSVLNQTYRDLEIIVVDDASSDNTEEVVKSLKDERIRYIRHEENKGAPAARNTGIEAAKGEYIAFQDSDDEWLPHKLEKQISIIDKLSSKVGLVYSDMWRLDHNRKREYWASPRIMPESGIFYYRALDYGVLNIGTPTIVVRKECFDKIGVFDERLPRFIDLEFLIRTSKYYYFYHIPEPLVAFRASQKQPLKRMSSQEDPFIIARELILEKYFEDIKKNKKLLSKHYFKIGDCYQINGEIKQSRKYFMKAAIANPQNIRFIVHYLISLLGQNSYTNVMGILKRLKTLWK